MNELRHFIGALRGEHESWDDRIVARRGIEICIAIKRSAEKKDFVAL